VLRSYVAVRELLSAVVAMLLSTDGPEVEVFDTGGDATELGDLAGVVARVIGGTVSRNAITDPDENRYVGDTAAWAALLARQGMVHLPVEAQVVETAAWLARQVTKVDGSRLVVRPRKW
jgi:nucleoside-diphosphate-sugar epimerase